MKRSISFGQASLHISAHKVVFGLKGLFLWGDSAHASTLTLPLTRWPALCCRLALPLHGAGAEKFMEYACLRLRGSKAPKDPQGFWGIFGDLEASREIRRIASTSFLEAPRLRKELHSEVWIIQLHLNGQRVPASRHWGTGAGRFAQDSRFEGALSGGFKGKPTGQPPVCRITTGC